MLRWHDIQHGVPLHRRRLSPVAMQLGLGLGLGLGRLSPVTMQLGLGLGLGRLSPVAMPERPLSDRKGPQQEEDDDH